MARILVIEDEEKMSRALERVLGGEGHVVEVASDGKSGLSRALEDSFDLLIVDWMLPGRSGVQVLRGLRAAEIGTPSLMLTAKGQVEDRVEGLDAGADDYLPKPFALQELLARVRALTRRPRDSQTETALRVGDVTLDSGRHVVRRGEEHVQLTAREFALLATLMQSPGRVFSRSVLLDTVWGVPGEVSTSVVELYVSYLRKKLDREGESSLIRTVRGVGYTFGIVGHNVFERIRCRLTFGYIGILAASLVVFGAIVAASFSRQLTIQQDKLLSQKAQSEATALVNGGDKYGAIKANTDYDIAVSAIPSSSLGAVNSSGSSQVSSGGDAGGAGEARVLDRDGSGASLGLPYPDLVGEAASGDGMVARTVRGPDGAVRLVSRPLTNNGQPVAVIQAAQSRSVVRETVLRLVAVLAVVGAGALGLAVAGGLYMSAKAMRPAREAFRLQRAFTADASHELKTPLALVRINAEEIALNPASQHVSW